MKIDLQLDPEADNITTVNIKMGLIEYEVLRMMLRYGRDYDSIDQAVPEVARGKARSVANRFIGDMIEIQDQVQEAFDHILKEVPETIRHFYLDPMKYNDEELMIAGIKKVPEDRVEHEEEEPPSVP